MVNVPNNIIKKWAAFKTWRVCLPLAALLFFMIGCQQLYSRLRATTAKAAPPSSTQVISKPVTKPVETKPSPTQSDQYTVPATQPRSMSLPSIGAEGLIQKVGLLSDGSVAAPTNVHFGGWYTKSVAPGDDGLSIIDGHVSGIYSDGIFKRLKELKPQSTISVEFGDHSVRNFEVINVVSVPAEKASEAFFKQEPGVKQQLNLITCSGAYDKQTKQFAERVIVTAKRI